MLMKKIYAILTAIFITANMFAQNIDSSGVGNSNEVNIEPADVPVKSVLPPNFIKLPGSWKFSKVLQNNKDVSAEFKWFKIDGKPITLVFEKDGRIVYPREMEKAHKIKEGLWQYMPGGKRDLQITTIMTDGSAKESFKIVSVTQKEFIYEDTRAKAKFMFVRTK